MSERPGLDEVLALDILCLRAPDGLPLDTSAHRHALAQSLQRSQWATVRREGGLVAYGYLWPLEDDAWFVGGLAIHPDHRTAPTVAALGAAMAGLVRTIGARKLQSHVLRGNAQSLRLHRRLGFVVEKENDRAIAFGAESASLLSRLAF